MPTYESLTILRRKANDPLSVGEFVLELGENGITLGPNTSISNQQGSSFLMTPVTVPLSATSVTGYVYTVSEGRWQMASVTVATSAASGAGGTLQIRAVAGATAPTGGTAQLTAVVDLTTTAPVVKTPALIASPTIIGPGDSLSFVFAGTLTGLAGNVTINLKRLS